MATRIRPNPLLLESPLRLPNRNRPKSLLLRGKPNPRASRNQKANPKPRKQRKRKVAGAKGANDLCRDIVHGGRRTICRPLFAFETSPRFNWKLVNVEPVKQSLLFCVNSMTVSIQYIS